jgi:nucleoside phosphorylase
MVDVAIITAIYEEYRAIVEILEAAAPVVLPSDNPVLFGWRIGNISTSRYGNPYSVVVAQCPEQTQVPSSLTTLLTVQRFQPRYVIFAGIAGGINTGSSLPAKERLAQFDVLIASAVWGYEYGKVTNSFQPRPDLTFRADSALKQAAEIFGKEDKHWIAESRSKLASAGLSLEREVHAVVGPVASGDKIIDDVSSDFFVPVLALWPKLRGIEMEGAGAAAAVELVNSSDYNARFLMLRAISDMPRVAETSEPDVLALSERDAGKEGAANVVAIFIREFIRRGWPIPPLGETDDPGSGPSGTIVTPDPAGERSVTRAHVSSSLPERVVFYMADRELQENSGIVWSKTMRDALYERLLLEFRLVLLTMNTDGTIVIPPTYYLESPPLRELLALHKPLIELGAVKLLMSTPLLHEYLETKKDRYTKAAKFPAYFDAYFSNTRFHGLVELPFQNTAKARSIGRKTLAIWTRNVLGKAQKHGSLITKTQKFLDLAAKTERAAILYENVQEHQHAAGLSDEEARLLDYRCIMNRTYLTNYLSLGFTVPEASALVWDGLTWHLPRSGLNLIALTRMADELRLKTRIMMADPGTLIRWRSDRIVRSLFRSARQLLKDGESLTGFVLRMLREPFATELEKAFSA